jgi:hypothetical protein
MMTFFLKEIIWFDFFSPLLQALTCQNWDLRATSGEGANELIDNQELIFLQCRVPNIEKTYSEKNKRIREWWESNPGHQLTRRE